MMTTPPKGILYVLSISLLLVVGSVLLGLSQSYSSVSAAIRADWSNQTSEIQINEPENVSVTVFNLVDELPDSAAVTSSSILVSGDARAYVNGMVRPSEDFGVALGLLIAGDARVNQFPLVDPSATPTPTPSPTPSPSPIPSPSPVPSPTSTPQAQATSTTVSEDPFSALEEDPSIPAPTNVEITQINTVMNVSWDTESVPLVLVHCTAEGYESLTLESSSTVAAFTDVPEEADYECGVAGIIDGKRSVIINTAHADGGFWDGWVFGLIGVVAALLGIFTTVFTPFRKIIKIDQVFDRFRR